MQKQTFLEEFLQNMTGGLSAAFMSSAFLWCLVGLSMSLILSAANRKPATATDPKPVKFSFAYLVSDNVKRIAVSALFTLLVLITTLRFMPDLLGLQISMFYSFLVGLGVDRIKQIYIKRMKSKNIFESGT